MSVSGVTFDSTEIPGQGVLPGFSALMGVEAAALKNPKHELFCVKFVEHGGDTALAYQSAIDCNCERLQAQKNAHYLLKKQEIARRIDQISSVMRNRCINEVIAFQRRALNFDPADYLHRESGRQIRLHELPEDKRRGIGLEARVVDGGIVYLPVFPSPQKAAESLSKMMGIEKQSVELSGKDGKPIATESVVQFYIPSNGRD